MQEPTHSWPKAMRKIKQFFADWKLSEDGVSFGDWKLKIVVLLYFAILIFAVAVPLITSALGGDVESGRTFERTGLNIAIVGMIGVLLVPFVKLMQDASESRKFISRIHADFSGFDFLAVSVTPRQGLNHLVRAVDAYHAPLIFLGFKDKPVLKALLDAVQSKQRGALYINPRTLTSLIELIDEGRELPPTMVYVTDCPRESCTIFGSDTDGKMNGIIFRYLPRRTIGRQDECWWSATLSSSYPQYLYDTYDRHYRREAATLITSRLKIRLLHEVNQRRTKQNRELISNHLAVQTRPLAYTYAASLLRQAQYSILSVDIMSPRLWMRTGGFIYDYIQAHKRPGNANVVKMRIHGYDKRYSVDADVYREFIKMHRDIKVDLFFVEAALIKQTGIERGFVIVDDEMVFLAEDLAVFANQNQFTLEDLESAQDLLECGFFEFTGEGVAKHKELFERLRRKKSRFLSAEEFERQLLAGVSTSAISMAERPSGSLYETTCDPEQAPNAVDPLSLDSYPITTRISKDALD